nr:MAG TPA: hypothetical protein [Caudoviricetes sp.]
MVLLSTLRNGVIQYQRWVHHTVMLQALQE